MFDYFLIKSRLEQEHDDIIREIAIKAIAYPRDYIEDLKKKFSTIQSESFKIEISKNLRLDFNNYIEPKDFNLRPLSKITHDVIEELRPDLLEELEEK
jgi:hypothetical protein